MCRWLAYSGPRLRLSEVLTRPNHSLIDQSLHARQNVETTNGDGFGVGWYGDEAVPGVYRDIQPAWNDINLRHLAEHIRAGLFMSHVRAATGTPVQYTNCHPFAFENWLFQHNGSIPEFSRLKRRLLLDVAPDLFPYIAGSTDSEVLFYLALTFGLRDDPPSALARMIGHVERVRAEEKSGGSLYFTACVSDGTRIWAVRYSSEHKSRTLYHSRHITALTEIDGTYQLLPPGAVVVVSEPVYDVTDHWEAVPEASLLLVKDGQVSLSPVAPK